MKCEIIRDLLPSYIEGLTSEESNQSIEDHLKTCPKCKKYFEEMQASITAPEIDAASKAEIQPFKKLKKKTWRAIGVTVIIWALVFGGVTYYYNHGWIPSSEDVNMTCEKVGDVVTLSFYNKDKNVTMTAYLDYSTKDGSEQITLNARHANPFKKSMRQGAYYGYTFIDDSIVYNEDGSKRKLTDEDILVIKYKDKDVKIKIKDLADGKL